MSEATVEIREITEADLPAVLWLYVQLAEGRPESQPADPTQAITLLTEIRSDPRRTFLVATTKGAVAATADMVIVPNLTHGVGHRDRIRSPARRRRTPESRPSLRSLRRALRKEIHEMIERDWRVEADHELVSAPRGGCR